MDIQIIQVPYDSGHKGNRTGCGPDHFIKHGIDKIIQNNGNKVSICCIEAKNSFLTEIGTSFELNCSLAEQINLAIKRKAFPLVFAGNCNSCLGTVAGIGQKRLGIVWFDAHGDFNTPETTPSGFLDGMGLAMVTGRCWRSLLNTIPKFSPIPEANIIHIGSRDLDQEEEMQLNKSKITRIKPHRDENVVYNSIHKVCNQIKKNVSRIYVHVDMDVLDTGEALPNHLAVPGGLPIEVVDKIIKIIKSKYDIVAGAITSFDPEYDKEDRVLNAGISIVKALIA